MNARDAFFGDVPLWQCSASGLSRAYARGELSPVDVLHSVQLREEQVQPVLNAMVCGNPKALQEAQASAQRWSQGQPLSALDGVPFTVKDNIAAAQLPCTWGSQLLADYVPSADELPVQRLRAAGCVLLGKTNVPEFTLQGYTDNILHGTTRNPWDPRLTPGGSSGGAVAAVACGVGAFAIATDGGGSIRRPCSYTGLVGLKPTWGAVPRSGGLPEILPQMEVIGPIARTTEDVVQVLRIVGNDSFQLLSPPPPKGLRIAYWRHIDHGPVDAQVLQRTDAFAQQLRTQGHRVHVCEAPAEVALFNAQAWPVISAAGLAHVLQAWVQRLSADGVRQQLTPAMSALWAQGAALHATDLFAAQQLVHRLQAALAPCWAQADVILTPAAAALPWDAQQPHPEHINGLPVGPRGHAVFTAFVNACGLPALAYPAGHSAEGLPVGVQLVGRKGADALLLGLAQSVEAVAQRQWVWPSGSWLH